LETVCREFKEFAHTEYMLEYYYNKTNRLNNINYISFITFNDMRKECEQRWANIANENLTVHVTSFKEFQHSRTRNRYFDKTNTYLTIIFEIMN